ncbi:hypothetical protein [Massilia cavernae]|uniref:hypothetical protein n=1 Tax=Massilia cavernae TaxID=2320864 RepID=UPI0011C37CD2|nr:hypothetical protein [Massilia cavernae]
MQHRKQLNYFLKRVLYQAGLDTYHDFHYKRKTSDNGWQHLLDEIDSTSSGMRPTVNCIAFVLPCRRMSRNPDRTRLRANHPGLSCGDKAGHGSLTLLASPIPRFALNHTARAVLNGIRREFLKCMNNNYSFFGLRLEGELMTISIYLKEIHYEPSMTYLCGGLLLAASAAASASLT